MFGMRIGSTTTTPFLGSLVVLQASPQSAGKRYDDSSAHIMTVLASRPEVLSSVTMPPIISSVCVTIPASILPSGPSVG